MWKALKWVPGTTWTFLFIAVFWVWLNPDNAKRLFPYLFDYVPSPALQPFATVALLGGWLLLCVSLWMLADMKEGVAALSKVIPFIPNGDLQPQDFDLAAYEPYYQLRPEFREAQKNLETGKLLIIGRPMAGKTRMAFELAKASHGFSVVRLPTDFKDWKDLNIPQFPSCRLELLWFIDDLHEHVGRLDVSHGEHVLKGQCELRILATSRSGAEWERLRLDNSMRAFAESMQTLDCSDFTEEEIVELARKLGKEDNPDLYDGTPGSVLLGLDAMRKLLEKASPASNNVMRAMFLLRQGGIFEPATRLVSAAVAQMNKQSLKASEFEEALRALVPQFLNHTNVRVVPRHDVYLSPEFFPYCPDTEELEAHLKELETVIPKVGTPSELHSFGLGFAFRGDYHNAAVYLRLAAERMPEDPQLAYNLGVALGHVGHLDEALVAFKRSLAFRPDEPDTLGNMAIALDKKGQHDEALETYRRALAVNLNHANNLYNFGLALGRLKQYEEAIPLLGKAATLRPDHPETHSVLGAALSGNGQYKKAVAAFERSLALRPDQPVALNNLAAALDVESRLHDAITAYRKSLTLQPNQPRALNNLGYLLSQQGLVDEGLAYIGKALEIEPHDPDALHSLGSALARKGRLEEAIVAFQESLTHRPDHPPTLFDLGGALRQACREEDAKQALDRAYHLDPRLDPRDGTQGP